MRLAALLLPLLLSGCALLKLDRELRQLPDFVMFSGEVRQAPAEAPVLLSAILREPGQTPRVVEQQLQLRAQSYAFVLEAGEYDLAAFSDLNFNDAWDAGEPAAVQSWRTQADGNALQPYSAEGLDLVLSTATATALPSELDAALRAHQRPGKPIAETGEIVPLDDRRFAEGNGEIALWRPLSWLRKLRGGITLLEPYDAAKTPVLFVHGAGGTPADFAKLAGALDRSRYQAWFYYYASGLSLEFSAQRLVRLLEEMKTPLEAQGFIVVAHSMGGLVARRALLLRAQRGERPARLLLSLATPWDGVAAAQSGVRYSPAVIPCWRDLAPGSAFLSRLREPLPAQTRSELLFGYRGGGGLRLGNTDGVVELSSQLAPWAQAQAARIQGLNEDHAGMVAGDSVRETLRAVLAR